jgi:putative transcriptional regulator
MIKQYRSRIMAAIHDIVTDLHEAGLLGNRVLQVFDAACLTQVKPLSAVEIRALRAREGASEAVFARCLNVPAFLVGQWERGEKQPQGPSLKLLTLVARNGLQAVA